MCRTDFFLNNRMSENKWPSKYYGEKKFHFYALTGTTIQVIPKQCRV